MATLSITMEPARTLTQGEPIHVRHVRPPKPIRFPTEEKVPEGRRHFELRTFLFRVLKLAFAGRAGLGSDQFVYWHGSDPRRCLAPDVFVHLGAPDEPVKSWKTWERGTPQLAVEIVSDPETEVDDFSTKLERYHELGVRELVLFDPDAPPGARLRVWDRVEDDLVERVVEDDRTPCLTLSLHWVVAPVEGFEAGLRLARDAAGEDLLPSPEEAFHRKADAAEREADAARREAEAAKQEAAAARARLAELEKRLAPPRRKRRP
jgi:Uma2 family endonuclease